MKTLFTIAAEEEQARKEAQYDELQKLQNITTKAIKETGLPKNSILEALDIDIEISKKINGLFKIENGDPFALMYNKLPYLLKGAKILVDQNFDQISLGNYDFLQPSNQAKTSIANYAQTAMLEILSIARKVPVHQIPDLQQEKIYDINKSPNIQGVRTKNKEDTALSSVKDWKWCYSAEAYGSKGYHELTVPGLGYYFGGTRYGEAYASKKLKQEDCSSAVAKWLGLSDAEFTTNSLLNPTQDVLSVLAPLKEEREPAKGDVFVFRGHCGIVAGYSDSEAPIGVLSYTRSMPFFEGLIYQDYYQVNNGKNVTTADWKALAQVDILKPYYGLDTNLGNVEEPNISGDIFYLEPIDIC
jgi:hypothetical protein